MRICGVVDPVLRSQNVGVKGALRATFASHMLAHFYGLQAHAYIYMYIHKESSLRVTVESQSYHKSCFKCSHGGCAISPSNYAALEGILYCKHHFSQLFKEKGSYNHLIKSASMKRPTASVPES
ncbi:hypothetical protein TEA_009168 [Camellia sinensis var. sinensis]|uniref:LIM zinc-binding domain-containing protein n=1 Tax=Camellia sinensis var. sinensis TaxID=542762 RepID=A0A4S4EAP2_CAMSN|nr:hypothetical protein TEA_009168 [Camellia sinensis var. sinensis]